MAAVTSALLYQLSENGDYRFYLLTGEFYLLGKYFIVSDFRTPIQALMYRAGIKLMTPGSAI